jgi:hypothetical protein
MLANFLGDKTKFLLFRHPPSSALSRWGMGPHTSCKVPALSYCTTSSVPEQKWAKVGRKCAELLTRLLFKPSMK